jgi:hypothetical protein
MDDLGYDDSLHPPSEVHIADDHMSRGERMSSPIPDSPLSSAPNSAPSSPGRQHPSLHGYTGDLDGVEEHYKSLEDGLNGASSFLNDNMNLPELDHEKPHRMDTDPGMIPISSVPSSKSDAPFDEAGLETAAPTANPIVFSPIPVRSKPNNTLWKRENHHNNDDYEEDEDDLLSSSHPRSSPISPQQRRLMKNRRQSANMKLNTSNISSSSSISNTGGSGSQHQHLNLNSPSTISIQQQDPKQSKSDIVNRAKQVMARRSSATLPFEDEEVSTANENNNTQIDDDEIPDDERRARTLSSKDSISPPQHFSGRFSNPTAATGSGISLALSPRDEHREVPMDEPDPPSPVRSLPDSSNFDRIDNLQHQAPSMDVAPSVDEARPSHSYRSAAATTSSRSFGHDDDYQQQHPYLDDSFVSRRTTERRPQAIVSITTTATASVLSPSNAARTTRLSPGLHVTTTDAVQVQEGNDIDNDGGGFETHIVPPAQGSPFSEQQSAVGMVDESCSSSDGSLEKYRDEEIEISFHENDDGDSYTDDDDEDDPLSGILDPGQFPRMAAKAFVSAQTDFTNYIMGRPELEGEEVASPARSEVEPPFLRTKAEPTGGQVMSKLLPTGGQVVSKLKPTGGQVVSKLKPTGGQVVSKSEPTGGQVFSKSEPKSGQVVTTSEPKGGQVVRKSERTGNQTMPTALLARGHYQDTALTAAAIATYSSDGDGDTGFGWVDDLVHEGTGLVGMVAVPDAFKSFKPAAVSDQIQSGVCTPLNFAASTTVAPKSVRRIDQGSSLKPTLATSFSSISSGSSVADDDSKMRQSRGQILDDLVAQSMEEAETVNGISPVTSPVRKNGKDGVWWLELELSKREAVKQAGDPLGTAEKIIAIGARDDKFQKAAAPQAKNNPSMRSSKDSQQGKPKPSKFWQGVRTKRPEHYNEVMSDEEEREQEMANGLGEGSGMDSIAKYGSKSPVESPLPKEPPSLLRSNKAFDADRSFDDTSPTDDEPPSLRPLSSNALSRIKNVQSASFAAPEDEAPSLSPSASLNPRTSNPQHQSGSGGNNALPPDNDDDEDNASHSMDTLMNGLDDMVNSLEALTPTDLRESAKSNDVEGVKSPQEEIPTPKQRARADPDAISNGSPIEDTSTKSQRVRADPDAISNGKLILVESIDNDFGIPIGDIMISLLNEDTDVSWASRVHEAIWRCRTMRRNFDSKYLQGKHEHQPGNPSVGRTSVPVDVDDARMIGGVGSVSKTQGAAQEHLKYDDFDDALMLYEDIIFSYYRFFDEVLKKSEAELLEQNVTGKVSDFKPYIGAALHNIGMVHLLKGDHEAAFTHFERAVLNRAACLGNGHVDYVVSERIGLLLLSTGVFSYSRAYSHSLSPVDLPC